MKVTNDIYRNILDDNGEKIGEVRGHRDPNCQYSGFWIVLDSGKKIGYSEHLMKGQFAYLKCVKDYVKNGGLASDLAP